MLNAVKISGRTKNGLGIDFFNALTENTTARIKTTTEQMNGDITTSNRKEVINPFSNYDIIA
jgi:hypothetical protein